MLHVFSRSLWCKLHIYYCTAYSVYRLEYHIIVHTVLHWAVIHNSALVSPYAQHMHSRVISIMVHVSARMSTAIKQQHTRPCSAYHLSVNTDPYCTSARHILCSTPLHCTGTSQSVGVQKFVTTKHTSFVWHCMYVILFISAVSDCYRKPILHYGCTLYLSDVIHIADWPLCIILCACGVWCNGL